MNKSLKKDNMRYFLLLCLLSLLCLNACQNTSNNTQEKITVTETNNVLPADHYSIWESAIQAFEKEDQANPPADNGIVFIGSSSIRFWESLADDMASLPIIRRGFGGSKIADAVHYADRIVTNYKPQIVVVFSGTNDLAGNELDKEPQAILKGYQDFVTKVKTSLPEVKIFNISITPTPARQSKIKEIKETNQLIKAYSDEDSQLFFFDLEKQFITENGEMRPELFIEDGLHLNAKGYEIWTDLIKPVLEAVYEE